MSTPKTHTATSAATAHRAPRSGLTWWQAVLYGAVAATAVNLAIWAVATLSGATLALADGAEDYVVGPGAVILASVAPMAIGISLAAALALLWPGVMRLAQIVGALFAVGTLWSVFSEGIGAATIVSLTLMHLVSGIVVVLALEGLRRHVRSGRADA